MEHDEQLSEIARCESCAVAKFIFEVIGFAILGLAMLILYVAL